MGESVRRVGAETGAERGSRESKGAEWRVERNRRLQDSRPGTRGFPHKFCRRCGIWRRGQWVEGIFLYVVFGLARHEDASERDCGYGYSHDFGADHSFSRTVWSGGFLPKL